MLLDSPVKETNHEHVTRVPAKHFLHVSKQQYDSQSQGQLRARAMCLPSVFYTERVDRLQKDPHRYGSCSSKPV